MSLRRAAAPMLLALAACSSSGFSGDPFPIYVDRAGGAFVVDIRVDDGEPQVAVLDLLSPLTFLDAPVDDPPRRRSATIKLLGHRSPGSAEMLTRARFGATPIYQHPCDTAECTIGTPGVPTVITGVIGADTLGNDAIRFHPAEDRLEVLPDIAGDGPARDRACDAELPSPFYGGGTLIIGGTELPFSGLRIALSVCLSPDPDQPDTSARGTDAAMVLSSGIGPSILGASRYQTWARAHGGIELDALPPATVLLPSGPIEGKLARIDRLAIVGDSTPPRGACREVYAHHLLTMRDCMLGDDCPCTEDDEAFCPVPSAVELATSIDVLVVPDTEPLLQALRAELRPAQPEIDGILGMSALAATELDVDYPHGRLLFRCAGAGCAIRPALRDRNSRPVIEGCASQAVPLIDAGVGDALDLDAVVP